MTMTKADLTKNISEKMAFTLQKSKEIVEQVFDFLVKSHPSPL